MGRVSSAVLTSTARMNSSARASDSAARSLCGMGDGGDAGQGPDGPCALAGFRAGQGEHTSEVIELVLHQGRLESGARPFAPFAVDVLAMDLDPSWPQDGEGDGVVAQAAFDKRDVLIGHVQDRG